MASTDEESLRIRQVGKLEWVEPRKYSKKEHSCPNPKSDAVTIVAHVEEVIPGDREGIPSAQPYSNLI